MTSLQQRAATARRRLPADLSPTGKLVYLYLAERGNATADEMKDALGIPQIYLYPALDALDRKDFVSRTGDEFTIEG